MSADILDPFHQQVARRVNAEIERLAYDLAGGSASKVTEDNKSVAEKYAFTVGYIEGLKAVLGVCQEVESGQHQLGPRLATTQVRER